MSLHGRRARSANPSRARSRRTHTSGSRINSSSRRSRAPYRRSRASLRCRAFCRSWGPASSRGPSSAKDGVT